MKARRRALLCECKTLRNLREGSFEALLYTLDQTRHRCSWALQTYHGTQNGEHTEVRLILYNCVLAGLAGVWFLTFHYWSCSLTLASTNITVSLGFYADCRI